MEEQLKKIFRILSCKSFQNEKMHYWCESTKWRNIHSNTYSETSWTESSLHFSVGSANSFKAGLRISVKVTWSKVAGKWGFLENTSFLIFSKALFLVPLFSSDRQLISLWRLYKRKKINSIIFDEWANESNYWKIQAWMGFKLWPLQCWRSSQPVELLGQLGADS